MGSHHVEWASVSIAVSSTVFKPELCTFCDPLAPLELGFKAEYATASSASGATARPTFFHSFWLREVGEVGEVGDTVSVAMCPGSTSQASLMRLASSMAIAETVGLLETNWRRSAKSQES